MVPVTQLLEVAQLHVSPAGLSMECRLAAGWMLNGHHSADADFTYWEKSPFQQKHLQNICSSKYMLGDAEIYPWFALQLLKTPQASSRHTVGCTEDEMFPSACAGWAILYCFFPSSSLTCTAFVSSAPCRHMNHCFIAGAAKQLAPLLRQYACSIACKAGLPAEKATAGFCVVPAVISGSIHMVLSTATCKTSVWKVKSRAASEKNCSGLCCFTFKLKLLSG